MLCSTTKLLFSLFSDCSEILPHFIRNHAEKCVSCRQDLIAEEKTAEALTTSQRNCVVKSPPFLAEKIVLAVRKANKSERPEHLLQRTGFLTLAGAFCLVVLAAGLFIYQNHKENEKRRYAAEQIAVFTEAVFSPLDNGAEADTFQTSAVIDIPIQSEFKRIAEDFYDLGKFVLKVFPEIEKKSK